MWVNDKNEDTRETAKKIIEQFTLRKNTHYKPMLRLAIKVCELHSLSNTLSKEDINEILLRMSHSKFTTIDEFEKVAQEIESEKIIEKWQIFIPINIKIPKRKFSFYGKKYLILTKDAFKKESGSQSNNIPNQFISTFIDGYSTSDVLNKIENEIQVFIGILSFSIFISNSSWKASFEERKRIENIQILYKNRSKHNINIESLIQEKNRKHQFSIPENNKMTFNDLISLFKLPPKTNSTNSLIADSLRLYSDSLNSINIYNAFLNFWQLAEVICLSENVGGRTDKIIARLSWHLTHTKLANEQITRTLKNLSRKRNDFVHRGIKSIDQDDLNIIKYLTETALVWLINIKKQLQDKSQIETFYKYRTSNNKTIKDTLIALNMIKNI